KSDQALQLILTGFDGKRIDPSGSIDAPSGGDGTVDLRAMYPAVANPGTYVLFAVPKGGAPADFVGTPIVVSVMADRRPGAPAGPMVIHMEPLRYAVMTTDAGPITIVFYFDVAPNTADSFLRLASQGYFDGLTFHRIIPDFVIQGGDPRGDGTGGPGYNIDAEFNDRPHEEGALSMARNGDPDEGPGVMPRPEFANSAGSQFFICLDYAHTKQLDKRYTVFGKVVDGMDAVRKIAATPLVDAQSGRPVKPPVMQKVEVRAVTPGNNPYSAIIEIGAPTTTQPAGAATAPAAAQ
ncbi:MAG TPA: peptidylprolyl isomerase, partial [Tepidisphaeraceae bacterium]|nr:peptidylprolyl isomerase [Tepidisphaeraceae bacterium]